MYEKMQIFAHLDMHVAALGRNFRWHIWIRKGLNVWGEIFDKTRKRRDHPFSDPPILVMSPLLAIYNKNLIWKCEIVQGRATHHSNRNHQLLYSLFNYFLQKPAS